MKGIYIFVGPPGAGKGTQASLFCKEVGIPHISTGEILRAAMQSGSSLGREVKDVVDRGVLVSDDLMIALIKERTAEPDCGNGFLLDGFPRTIPQAEALEKFFESAAMTLSKVVLFEISDDVLLSRLAGRRTDGSRDDDKEETQLKRIRIYEESTSPLIGFYDSRGYLGRVDADADVETVKSRVMDLLSQPQKI
ncbi:MAG TPA: adenylate kinase [Oligoflexia bacterium]|nr:adenylate kinase [Oligoflexia bacterium]HMP49804.1 adenylate kinase [Oligoflexia bacterium]